jgi:hypothetical protein
LENHIGILGALGERVLDHGLRLGMLARLQQLLRVLDGIGRRHRLVGRLGGLGGLGAAQGEGSEQQREQAEAGHGAGS